jgi:lipopolysaccharide export system protein LptC
MKSRLNHLLPIALMLLLAAMTLWLRFAIETPPVGESGKNRHDPDAIGNNVTITRMDALGNAQYRVFAKRMVHFPDNDSMELSAPRFVRKDATSDLTVTAGRGVVNQETQDARFNDNVELVRRPTRGADVLTIRTQYMQVLMDREVARTDRNVAIVNGASTLTGTGMEYEKKTGRLSLQSGVKGSFHVQKR